MLETLLWRTNSILAISEHGAWSSIYDEDKAVVRTHQDTTEKVEVQLSQYCRDGFPDDKGFTGKKGEHSSPSFMLMSSQDYLKKKKRSSFMEFHYCIEYCLLQFLKGFFSYIILKSLPSRFK